MKIRINKDNINISSEMKEIITGMLLGDAYLCKTPKSANIEFIQADKEFIDHLYSIFNSLTRTGPNLKSHSNKKYNKTYYAYKFRTLTFPYFAEIYPCWYMKINGRNKKIIPKNIEELITARSLAYWIMCDGHYDKRDEILRSSTDSFLPSEVSILQSVLLNSFSIESRMHSNGYENQYRIYIPKREAQKVKYLIKPYLIDCFLYKIGE